MKIEIQQLPPVSSSPNWRGHWAERYQAARVYHAAVFYSCVDAINRAYREGRLAFTDLPFKQVKLALTFIFAKHRRRDRDNLISCFKPGLDGIVQAGLIVDDDAEHLEISNVDILVDPERAPLTIIGIERLEEGNDGNM